MKLRYLVLLLFVACPLHRASATNAVNQDPIAWGMLTHNSGCVIFAEGRKTKGMFWGVAVTATVTGKLTVIEAQNYTLSQKEYLETQDTMNDLMRLAQKDNVKFVKIPEKYPPALLDQARAMCKAQS